MPTDHELQTTLASQPPVSKPQVRGSSPLGDASHPPLLQMLFTESGQFGIAGLGGEVYATVDLETGTAIIRGGD